MYIMYYAYGTRLLYYEHDYSFKIKIFYHKYQININILISFVIIDSQIGTTLNPLHVDRYFFLVFTFNAIHFFIST